MNPYAPFPTLHPLVVHAPLVLLPLAALLLIVAWASRNRVLDGAATGLLAAGWVGALLASKVFHPHTGAMTLLAREALETHEFWADWTLVLSSGALLISFVYRFQGVQPLRRILKISALVLYLGAAAAVTLAGHYGALLTHVYKVKVEKE
jgi:uncharacterized membrane protein